VAADPASASSLRRFRIALVVRDSLRIWMTTLPRFALVSLLVFLPEIGLFVLLAGTKALEGVSPVSIALLFTVVTMTTLFAVQGAVALMVFQSLRGEKPDVFRTIQAALRRLLPILGVVVSIGFVSFVASFVIAFLTRLFLLFVLLSIPLIVLFVAWSVAIPATVVEPIGPWGALARSARLTKGERGRIFVVWLVCALIWWVFTALVTAVMSAFGSESGIASVLVRTFFLAVLGSFPAVVPAVIYHELRESREGIGLDQLASVFQ
jgi:hypothetical protein